MERSLLQQNMVENHYRALKVLVAVCIIITLATVGTYLAGKASDTVTVSVIIVFMASWITIVGITWFIIKHNLYAPWSKWLMVIAAFIIIMICRVISPEFETVNMLYLIIVFSLFYFDFKLTIFSSLLCIFGDVVLLQVLPYLKVDTNALSIRYTSFIFTAVASAMGAKATEKLIQLATEREQIAKQFGEKLKLGVDTINSQSSQLYTTSTLLKEGNDKSQEAFTQISQSIEEIAATSSNQASFTEKTSTTIEEMLKALSNIGDSISQMNQMSTEFIHIVEEGRNTMQNQTETLEKTLQANEDTTLSIEQLNKQSAEIGLIAATISNIADQTGMLALNAAIEAARAGEAGKGFAVVAEQVRKLADESAKAAANINDIIHQVQTNTADTTNKIEQTGQAFAAQAEAVRDGYQLFDRIDKQSTVIDTTVQEISATIEELMASGDEIGDAVSHISTGAQQLAAASEEVSAITSEQITMLKEIGLSINHLQEMADQLKQQASQMIK